MTPDQIDDQAWSTIERRVTQLEEALRLTVEYVGIQTLRPLEGWSWYDALHSCDWFPEWLARMPGAGPTDPGPAVSDDESKPMTRTELAMLWDLLGRWPASHPLSHGQDPGLADAVLKAGFVRLWVDAELTERFGS